MGERIAKASKVPLWGQDGVDCFHKERSTDGQCHDGRESEKEIEA
jgi:hypothetical protein